MQARTLNNLQIEIIPDPTPASFADRVVLWFLHLPKAYKLTADLNVDIDGELYTVYKGTLIDGFTVPRGFRWIVAPIGPQAAAAAVHDDMYNRAWRNKEYADDAFNALLTSLGCPRWARIIATAAVRRFGKGKYKND